MVYEERLFLFRVRKSDNISVRIQKKSQSVGAGSSLRIWTLTYQSSEVLSVCYSAVSERESQDG